MAVKNKKTSFNANAIDDLIGNFKGQVNELEKKKAEALEKLKKQEISEDLNESFNQQFKPNTMFAALEDVLQMSIDLLLAAKQAVQAMPDGESLSGFASLVNSINSTFAEFSSMYKDQIKYSNAYNLEMVKFNNKKKLEEYKHKLKQQPAIDIDNNGEKTVPFNTWDIVKTITDHEKNKNDIQRI